MKSLERSALCWGSEGVGTTVLYGEFTVDVVYDSGWGKQEDLCNLIEKYRSERQLWRDGLGLMLCPKLHHNLEKFLMCNLIFC